MSWGDPIQPKTEDAGFPSGAKGRHAYCPMEDSVSLSSASPSHSTAAVCAVAHGQPSLCPTWCGSLGAVPLLCPPLLGVTSAPPLGPGALARSSLIAASWNRQAHLKGHVSNSPGPHTTHLPSQELRHQPCRAKPPYPSCPQPTPPPLSLSNPTKSPHLPVGSALAWGCWCGHSPACPHPRRCLHNVRLATSGSKPFSGRLSSRSQQSPLPRGRAPPAARPGARLHLSSRRLPSATPNTN